MMQVSVIIPIYKVERFIGRCAESLMMQSITDDVEFIFVDDCSPDGSIKILQEIIERYPKRQGQVSILRHKQNRGLPTARNTGLECAKGKYVFHCDSDDYLEYDALEQMLAVAESKGADVVWSDWYLSFERCERYMKQPEYATADDAVRGMLCGRMKYNVWNKFVKRSLYEKENIRFPDGHGMGEDMTMIRLFACASNVAYLPKALYHYIKTNGDAYTSSFTERNLRDIRYNVDLTASFLERQRGGEFIEGIACFKLCVKYPFLITDNRSVYAIWQEWYPEANVYIGKAPELSLRCRLLQYAAMKGHFWFIWLHYKVIFRFFYGFIYK